MPLARLDLVLTWFDLARWEQGQAWRLVRKEVGGDREQRLSVAKVPRAEVERAGESVRIELPESVEMDGKCR